MDKRETKEFTIEDRRTEFDTTVIYWEYGRGSADQITVTTVNDHVKEPQQRHTFRVTDEAERECVFRKNDVDGEPDPSRVAMKALGKFGWSCTNYDLEQLEQPAGNEVGPTLKLADDVLGNTLVVPDSPVVDHPFVLDIIETAQTATGVASTLVWMQESDDEDYLDLLFAEQNRDTFREWVAYECVSDPYNTLYLPELAEKHFGVTVTEAQIRAAEAGGTPERLKALGLNVEGGDGERRPPGFDGLRYAAWWREQTQ